MKEGNSNMENVLQPVRSFFVAIQSDPRIGATHIAVFMALYFRWLSEGGNDIHVFASEIMPVAKISSRMTYCKVISDLSNHGYIEYEPSFHKMSGSKIRIGKKSNYF